MESIDFQNLYNKYFGKRVYWSTYSNPKGIKMYASKCVGIAIKTINGTPSVQLTMHNGQQIPAEIVFLSLDEFELQCKKHCSDYFNFIKNLQS
jgi:hypothetical protein